MHLFTTRARRTDLAPEVRSLDLRALAATRGRVHASVRRPDRAALARELSRASGVRIDAGPGLEPEPLPWSMPVRATLVVGERRLTIGFDRPTRRAWLGLVLGLDAGGRDDAELPDEPSRLERAVFARTLVAPIARATLGDAAPAEPAIEWEGSAAGDPDRVAANVHRLVASTPAGPRELRLSIADSSGSPATAAGLDRAILAATVSLAVWLDPDRAGVSLQAGDLARFEAGDVLLTDLPADAAGSLPVAVVTRSPGPSDPAWPARKGHLGVAGARRAVRIG